MFSCQWDKEALVVSRILLPLSLQLKKAQMCLSHVILRRWASLWRPCTIKLTQELKPLDHHKRRMFVNWAEQQLENDSDFYEKSFSAMRLISGWMASSINKRCIIGQTAMHTYSISNHCIPNKLRFGAVYGPAASLGRTSSVMMKSGTLQWMRIASVQW